MSWKSIYGINQFGTFSAWICASIYNLSIMCVINFAIYEKLFFSNHHVIWTNAAILVAHSGNLCYTQYHLVARIAISIYNSQCECIFFWFSSFSVTRPFVCLFVDTTKFFFFLWKWTFPIFWLGLQWIAYADWKNVRLHIISFNMIWCDSKKKIHWKWKWE